MFVLPPALSALAAYRQFIVYQLVPSATKPGKMDKWPIDWRTGLKHDAHDPAVWLAWAPASASANTLGPSYGVGFVFTAADPFFFIDIDSCLVDGAWSPLAMELMGRFRGAAVEISQSGSGLHVIGSGAAPPHGSKNTALGLEFYTEKRFVALTGTGAIGDAATDHTAALAQLTVDYFSNAPALATDNWTSEACMGWNGPDDDTALIERALRSVSAGAAFGGRASFKDLWTADVDALARAYPDANGRPYDESSADAGLAQHLAFWTGKNCERIAALMWRSALVRDKWNREDYIPRTVLAAVARQVDVLADKPRAVPAPMNGAAVTLPIGGFLNGDEQIQLFHGCVYVCNIHRVLVPGGHLLKPDQFRAMFGGYSFVMDNANSRSVRNAFEAFIESQIYRSPRADGICFRPECTPGEIITEADAKLANVWWPIETPRAKGDAGPFIRHLEKLLPNDTDRGSLLAYLAAIVQNPGRKFQWAPLIQGVKGNGKTLVITAIARCVGDRYTHLPNVNDFSGGGLKFTGWLNQKLFIGLEEVYTAERREVLEALKPFVTNKRIEMQPKGVDQFTGDNRANFIASSNHKEAVPIDDDERRWAIYYTAQQKREHLARDGMDGNYFPDLWNWFEGLGAYAGRAPGHAVINDFLRSYAIPDELNPAVMAHRAPATSSTIEAIDLSRGQIEQEIGEAIEQELPGFAGGWISSLAVDRLLAKLRLERRMSPIRRKELIESLGYMWHPALINGRATHVIAPDNGRPKLYIRKGSLLTNLTAPVAVAESYTRAQMKALNFGIDGAVNKGLGSPS